MYDSRIDLSRSVREELMPLLQARLSDSIDLFTQIKQAHWNVKGPSFIALHELFERVAIEVAQHADLLAERVVQLGGFAEGGVRMVAERALPVSVTDRLRSRPRDGPRQCPCELRRKDASRDRRGGAGGGSRHGGHPDADLSRHRQAALGGRGSRSRAAVGSGRAAIFTPLSDRSRARAAAACSRGPGASD